MCTVVYDGGNRDKIFNEYGENDFLITYAGDYQLSFRHFKFYRRNQHDYNFHFYQKGSDIHVQVEISGQDSMKFDKPLTCIDLAK